MLPWSGYGSLLGVRERLEGRQMGVSRDDKRLDGKKLFWWVVIYCEDGCHYGGHSGIVWALTRDGAVERIREDYPEDSWSLVLRPVGDGDMVKMSDL